MSVMSMVIDGLSWILLLAGTFFVVVGAIGLVCMPDVFTRMHATSVTDTMGAGLMIAGMALQAGFTLATLKLAVLMGLFFFTGPVATHALARAALHANIEPLLDDDKDINVIPSRYPAGPDEDI